MGDFEHAILTPAEMYRADALAVGPNLSAADLMENAGQAVAEGILRRYKECRVAVLCGPGNNGGDGFVVARLLKAARWPVQVYLLGDRSALQGEAAAMAAKWRGAIRSLSEFKSAGLIVDALFGAGLSRDFSKDIADMINGAGVPVVAVDVPSGLDGLSGKPRGASVKADVTVTFFRKKTAHVLFPGRALCGDVDVADIGITPHVFNDIRPTLFENKKPLFPPHSPDAHKYSRGGVLIYSGDELHTGASRLAALAAARIGAGVVSICGSKDALRIHASHVSSIMLKTMIEVDLEKTNACCIGPACGIGGDTRRNVSHVLVGGVSVVLDADALTSFEAEPEALFRMIKKSTSPAIVMTPHEGEFRRLFKKIAQSDQPKHERARAAATQSGAIVLYKGPDTVIAHPDGRTVINTNGTPKLATAGSGDVLAGIITGLMAQGMDGFDSACAGAWLHADAANRIDRRTIIAGDLIAVLG
jgi:ADP-dependent NAD(P)H-hydrate dehydratase / NAD(P)H-hydrate epimerase